ncbi:MBL fold metallo-hydrolase [Streptomyces sp. NPDC051909]|uniref:MBL fold metallo-hydrolase n=1 Tax=Streptomyces sp. NPDC051909 TaxID=3154944 RepID=UPI00342FD10C
MNTRVDEVSADIYRISTFIPEVGPSGFTFNQFLIDTDEPLLYHTGMRDLFPSVSSAVSSIIPLEKLRWIAFSHVEADECGSMNQFLAAAPKSRVMHGRTGCLVSLNDLADRPPLPLADGERMEIGAQGAPNLDSRVVRHFDTPHVPHNWESRVLFEERSRTLFCGDLMTTVGAGPALTSSDLIDAAIEAERIFGQTGQGPAVPATLRRLADLNPKTLAIMHGPAFEGDGAAALRNLADAYEEHFPSTRAPE